MSRLSVVQVATHSVPIKQGEIVWLRCHWSQSAPASASWTHGSSDHGAETKAAMVHPDIMDALPLSEITYHTLFTSRSCGVKLSLSGIVNFSAECIGKYATSWPKLCEEISLSWMVDHFKYNTGRKLKHGYFLGRLFVCLECLTHVRTAEHSDGLWFAGASQTQKWAP